MFTSFPHLLKRYGLDVDVRFLLELYQTMDMGLVTNLGSLFNVGEYLIVKSRRDLGPYTMAFWEYFLGIDVTQYSSIDEAVFRSKAFEQWYSQQLKTGTVDESIDPMSLIDQFLNETLHSDLRANIQKELDARELLDQDNPDREDRPNPNGAQGLPPLNETMVDYSNISLDELMDRMRRVAEQQKTQHNGGSHWIGSRGNSPYGHSGHGLNGIRVGGGSYAGTARKVMGNPEFFKVDTDAHLSDDTMDAAFQILKHVVEHHEEMMLDVDKTVEQTGRNAGILVPHFKQEQLDRTRVMLLLDNGGNSMRAHSHQVQKLFAKIKRRFNHDLKIFYFHNTIYDQVYEDEARRETIILSKLMEHSPEYKVFVIGDAYMGPHELLSPYGSIEYREESETPSIHNLQSLRSHFPHMVWINPVTPRYWTQTVASVIQQIIPMEPLTIQGIVNAVQQMNQPSPYSRQIN